MRNSTPDYLTVNGKALRQVLVAALVLFFTGTFAQSAPVAQALPYTQNFGTTTFTTMPAGTAAWGGTNGNTVNTQALAEATVPSANATVAAATVASGTGGCYGYAASSNASFYVQTSSSTSNGVNQLACAINTGAGVTSVTVGYNIKPISMQASTMGIVLQYRAGTSGSWTTVSGSAVSYTSGSSNGGDTDTLGDSDPYSYTITGLTASTVYQFRWAVWRTSGTSSGAAIDDISIAAVTGPAQNGTIAANEYGTHTDGQNQQTNSGSSTTTYMTWDATNLYVGVAGANLSEGYVLYLDKDPQALVNGGTNANGTLVGQNYDGSGFAALPFRADLVVFFKTGYREYRTANGSGGWIGTPVTVFGSYGESGTTREIAIPWSAIGGMPSSFNWFGYAVSGGGFVYGGTPTENPGGSIGTTARYERYYTVSTTTVGSSTPPFSRNSFVFNNASDETNFGPISVYDFTMNSSGRFLSRTGNTAGNWTIAGNMNVGAGTVYLGSGAGTYGTVAIAGNLNVSGGTYDIDGSTSATTVTGNVNLSAGTLKLSNSVGGDLNVLGNWNNTGGTFNANSRTVAFNGTTAQTVTGATTFAYLTLNNSNGLSLANNQTVNNTLTLTSGKITLGANSLTIGASGSISGATSAKYIVTSSTGQLKRTVGGTAVAFPVGNSAYNPITLTNSGTSDIYGINVLDGTIPAPVNDASKTVKRRWQVTEGAAGGSNLTVVAQYNGSEVDSGYNAASNPNVGLYTGSWQLQNATLGGSDPFTATTSTAFAPADLTSGTKYFAIGKSNGLAALAGTNLAITNITPANPTAGISFDVTVQLQDIYGNPVNPAAPLTVFLDSNGNAGDIYASGNQAGTIPTNANSVVISGVILPSPGTGVVLTAYDISFALTPGVSGAFNVLAPASQLAFVGVPATGSVGAAFGAFDVEARRPDNSLDDSYSGTITISKASGSGTLTATSFTATASGGVAHFTATNNFQFSAADTYTLHADATGLSQATSGSIVITQPPVDLADWDTSTLSSYGPSPFSATYSESHTAVGGLTRNAALTLSGTAASAAWGATGWDQGTSLATAIANGSYVTFTVTPYTGYYLKLDNIIGYNVRRSGSGPTTGQWQYSLDGTTFNNIGSAITWGGTTTSAGNAQASIDLTGISALQNVPSGTTVTFRIVNYGASNTTGTWYVNDPPTATTDYDFGVMGNATCIQPTAFNVTGGGAYCTGGSGAPIGLSGSQAGVSYQLKRNGTNVDAPVAGTGSAISFLNQSTAGTYTVVASNTNGTCSYTQTMTGSVTVSVDPASVGGTVSGGTTVCSGTNSTTLTLSGNLGTIQWQSSPDNITFTNIPGATSSGYTATNLTSTTYYRAVVTSGTCSSANSTVATVTVNPAAVGGTVSGDTTVCTGTNSTTLTLTGSTGSVQWQSSPDNVTFTNIGGATATTYTATNLTSTTYYRAVLSSSPCSSANSTVATITVNPAAVGGTVSGGTSVCSGTNSTTLTLSGSSGSIQWQSSPDNTTFTDIGGATSTTYTATNLTATTYYRAVLTSSPCTSVNSTVATITVGTPATAGTVTGGGTTCSGDQLTLTASGYTGSVQWQSSPDDVTYTNVSGQTASTITVTVSGTMYYRVQVSNGGPCPAVNSNSVSVGVGGSTTWDGSSWSNGAPVSGMTAVIAGNYSEAANITACSLTVNNNAVVDIPSGYDVTLSGALTVSSGSFTLENNANLLQSTSAANSGSITVRRNSSYIKRQDYTLWSSPVAGQNLLAFSPQTVTSRFYQYNSSTNQYNSVTPSSTTFADAKGYLIRVANNHPAFAWIWNGAFNGVPHNGDYSYTLYDGGAGFRYNLVGNPYPSPISAVSFASQNASQITGTLYFWRETNGNPNNNPYCTWSPAGGGNGTFVSNGEASVVDPQGVIQTGQGFFVEGTGSGAVAFHNDMRVANNANQFFRHALTQSPASTDGRIWLNATNPEGAFCQTALVYTSDATNGYDVGLDGKSIVDATTDLYWVVEGQKLSIQARAPFNASDIVPVVFKASAAGSYTIAIDHTEGIFAQGQTIYLRDNLAGGIYDITSSGYGFTSDAGTFEGRFDVLFQSQLAVQNPTLDNQLVVYKQDGHFEVNAGQMEMASVRVFDIRGRLITQLKGIDAGHASFSAGETNQVLIVRITGVNGEIAVRKVVK